MAYWVNSVGKNTDRFGVKSFYCESRSDIADLPKYKTEGTAQDGDPDASKPCSYGSDAFCLDDGSAWILTKTTNEWKEV